MRAPGPARRLLHAALAALLALACAADAFAAGPGVFVNTGTTFGISGEVAEGGMSLRGALMWPLEDERFATGVEVFAEDFGSIIGDLYDPNTGAYAGQSLRRHRAAYGGAWRFDAALSRGSRWEPYVSGSWGFGRVRDDSLGIEKQTWNSTAVGLGAGARRAVRTNFTVGAAARYQWLFNDRVGRYASVSLEWGWR